MEEQSAERLEEYRRKRDFTRTLEPSGADEATEQRCLYVMHKHAASHGHYDLRLEQDGVLRSWALPKGPSLESGEKRLAVEVEDHPLEYGRFEGVIPKGEYGGGTTMLWDVGHWRLNGKNKEGHLDFILDGEKLQGAWTLVRTRGKGDGRGKKGKSWLMIKRTDTHKHKLDPGDESVISGRTMEEIARDRDNVWIRGEAVAKPGPPDASTISDARKKPFPKELPPQLATLTDAAPEGDEWIHEIKLDGYRVTAFVNNGKTKLFTRNGHDWTRRFPEVATLLSRMPVDRAILDGEMVVMSDDGSSSFRKLQEALSRNRTTGVVFQVFDLLYLGEHDLTHAELATRKTILKQLVDSSGFDGGGRVRYSDHIRGQGPEFFSQACRLGLEGIISKRADGRYRSGRGRQWLKVKCTHHEEFVVGGFTAPGGSRNGFGSLLLGAYDDGRFLYAGRVGTGFSATQIDDLHDRLTELETGEKPFHDDVPDSRTTRWVKPDLVIEVEFTERTRDRRLRHPVFRGLRDDRDATEITLTGDTDMREETSVVQSRTTTRGPGKKGDATVAGVRITHPERVMYAEQGATKLDLARYYDDIQEWILPWLANRPLSLLRCPEGWKEECFFQKHPRQTIAKTLPRISIEESKGFKDYVYVQSIADVVSLVQVGVLEFHPWGAQVDDIEKPDLMIFDLDPSPEVPWPQILRTANDLRERLEALGLSSFPRTTGGKGLHLVVPLRPSASWDEVKEFAHAVSEQHARANPKRLTTNMSRTKRRGRIFIDYLRNGRGATAIASYSLRAREGAPVAVPVRWDELSVAMRSDRYNIDNVRRRLGALQDDPWEGFIEARSSITAKMRRTVGLE